MRIGGDLVERLDVTLIVRQHVGRAARKIDPRILHGNHLPGRVLRFSSLS
jgi:hypothetical protein